MRSFRSKVLSACAWAIPALSAALPSREVARPDVKHSLLELDLQETYAQATFSVPCPGCLGHEDASDDDALVLSFKTHSSDDSCGFSNITLNGVYLPQEWVGDFASGSGSFSSVADVEEHAWFLQHDLDLDWKSVCLQANESDVEVVDHDAAQVLTVTVKGVDGKPLDKPAGFTISFKQTSPPELLRLESVPNHSASDKANAETWRQPPQHLRLILAPVPADVVPAQGSLEEDIRELRVLQEEVQELHRAIKEKKKHIHSQLKNEAHSFKEELQQCDNITCVVKTIAHKAHGAWRLLYVRLRPIHHKYHHHTGMGRPNDPFAQVWRAGIHKGGEAAIKIESLPAPLPSHDGLTAPPHHKGHPPPPPPPPPHHGPHPPHGPQESPYVIALEIVLGILCCGCVFSVIRHKCCSLRTRTERAALREERRNARAYRRAAQRHAWRSWWRGNWRDQRRIEDYEEKRALIGEQESVLEEAMQEEIRQLRTAHGMVNSLVQAEEGRIDTHCSGHIRCHCHHYTSPPSPASSAYMSDSLAGLPSRPLSRTNSLLSRTSSLPGYQSDASTQPPAYEEDEDVSDVVANGFRLYSPSTASVDSRWTPESSVIDVSPRPSADTLRYAETTDTGVGDAKN